MHWLGVFVARLSNEILCLRLVWMVTDGFQQVVCGVLLDWGVAGMRTGKNIGGCW